MEGARWRGLIVRKYSGSHRELRPAGAEYKINDGLLKNLAAHSGLPYFGVANVGGRTTSCNQPRAVLRVSLPLLNI